MLRVSDARSAGSQALHARRFAARVEPVAVLELPSGLEYRGREALAEEIMIEANVFLVEPRPYRQAAASRATGPVFCALQLLHHPVTSERRMARIPLSGRVDSPAQGRRRGDRRTRQWSIGAGGGMQPYNLATRERIVRGRMPTMELISERFARYLRIGLFNHMHRNCRGVSVGAIRVQKYSLSSLRNWWCRPASNMITARPCAVCPDRLLTPACGCAWWWTAHVRGGGQHPPCRGAFTPPAACIQGMLCRSCSSSISGPMGRCSVTFGVCVSNELPGSLYRHRPEIVVATSFSIEFGGSRAGCMSACLFGSRPDPRHALLDDAERPPDP